MKLLRCVPASMGQRAAPAERIPLRSKPRLLQLRQPHPRGGLAAPAGRGSGRLVAASVAPVDPVPFGRRARPVLSGVPFSNAYCDMNWLLPVPLVLIEILLGMQLPLEESDSQ